MKIFLTCLACLTAQPAQAIDLLWQYQNAPTVKTYHHAKPKKVSKPKASKPKRKHYAKKAAPKSEPTRVLAFEERAEAGKCFRPLTVVGSQWVGESGAYDSAVKAMKERIRWDIGESAMDPAHWKDLKKRCSLSSVGEVAGQTFTRCELTATPCRPPVEPGSSPQ